MYVPIIAKSNINKAIVHLRDRVKERGRMEGRDIKGAVAFGNTNIASSGQIRPFLVTQFVQYM